MNIKNLHFIVLATLLPKAVLAAITFSQTPLFINSTEPRVMLVASRDHQLSVKAYTDYTDIDGGGLDTTYTDTVDYYGYFDVNKCYTYNTSNNRFEPIAAASAVTAGGKTHSCTGTEAYWSGNFLNWASMTRMDVLRKALYGGYRSTDTASTAATPGVTVLERHFLPNDVHAFVKVYNPGSASTIKQFVPDVLVGTNTSVSLCNVSDSTSSTLTGQMIGAPTSSSSVLPTPLIKLAAGKFYYWDATEGRQCVVGGNTNRPTALLGTYNARVKVCDTTGGIEKGCKNYTHLGTGINTTKPTGLLQQYGEVDSERRVRFGLMTGSYNANKSGGVLRKNVGFIQNNNNAIITSSAVCSNPNSTTTVPTTNISSNDEIDYCTGLFINQGETQAGIINTFNRLHIAGYQFSTGFHQYNCNAPTVLSFNNGDCVDAGNPLSEVYLESLRYFANVGPTSTFDVSDSSKLSSIPKISSWIDPLPTDQWCALCNIIVLSTGLNSFDTDELSSFTPSGGTSINANSLTDTVGDASHENINGNQFLIGKVVAGDNSQCTAKTITNLASAQGICPEIPGLEGGYGLAGLAYAPKTIDLRPAYQTQRANRWGGTNPLNADWALRQPIDTYTLQLGEALPSIAAVTDAAANKKVTILPTCLAIQVANAPAWPALPSPLPASPQAAREWRTCTLTNLFIDENVAQASVGSDATGLSNTCSGNGSTSRCMTIAWENSKYANNDNDMDAVQRLGYCIGTACNSFRMLCPSTTSATATIGPWTGVASNQVRVATCVLGAGIGSTMNLGYTITGSTADGPYYPILQNSATYSVGTVLTNASAANFNTFTQGASSAKLLENPLWYAAKYGGFIESAPSVGTPRPELVSEWDSKDNNTGLSGSDGIPDNYFNVRNPATLITALGSIFDKASQKTGDAASAATSSTSLRVESRIYQAKFSPIDWSGQLISSKLVIDNVTSAISFIDEWDAGSIINIQSNPSPGSRVILAKGTSDGVPFAYGNLTVAQQTELNKNIAGTTDNCGTERVDYLRGINTNEGLVTDALITCTLAPNNQISKFRQRSTSKLGDIVNSNPLFVGSPTAGYNDAEFPGYSAFRNTNINRKPMVYAGSNDGMLHGFDASLDFSSDSSGVTVPDVSGKELLAYIPTAVFPNLTKLTDQSYNRNHRNLVDGTPMAADADLDSSTTTFNWRTVLVGGLAGGGKGYYALDITNPSGFSEATASNTLLWEFDETDMGFAVNLPPNTNEAQAKQIVKVKVNESGTDKDKWVVVLGNGYNSVAGKAVLYVVFIENGIDGIWNSGDYKAIVADAPVSPATNANNGLSTPVPFDSDGDGYADTVYAGDLKGNLWKFLIGANASDTTVTSNTSTWRVAFSGLPLFTALSSGGINQPIISPPEVTLNPNSGQMVFFGTGKYLEPSDITSTDSQTFYGIWDKNDVAGTRVGTRSNDLLQQSISSLSSDLRLVSTNSINFRTGTATSTALANCTPTATCNPSHMGWYIDLPTSKERTTGIPRIISDILFFNTLIPSEAPCDAGGNGWFLGVDMLSGKQLDSPLFDTNGNTKVDSTDTQSAGIKTGASVGGTIIITNDEGDQSVAITTTTGGGREGDIVRIPPSRKGRLSWREIVN